MRYSGLWQLAGRAGLLAMCGLAVCFPGGVYAQDSGATGQITTLHATARLVTLDVVVQDKSGRPVRGLTRDSFHIVEDRKPQTVQSFEEHSAAAAPLAAARPLPPGTFTDVSSAPLDSTLNVLLLDRLNTATADQTWVLAQLREFVEHAEPNARVAIFGLGGRLTMLQGFTQDSKILRDAVERSIRPDGSPILAAAGVGDGSEDAPGTGAGGDPQGFSMQTGMNLSAFELEREAFQTQLRAQVTLDAFTSLGHYLAALPGRKNVMWFSGSFPLNIYPTMATVNPLLFQQVDEELFRRMVALLAQARVAVYPIDARGLVGLPNSPAVGNMKRNSARTLTADLNAFKEQQAETLGSMDQMAQDTGGKAFYNTNGLADAVKRVLAEGSSYYSLSYAPPLGPEGVFRGIHVEIVENGRPQTQLRLAYRQGYYTAAPPKALPGTATADDPAIRKHLAAISYGRLAMAHGAPEPADIPFRVRVLPEAGTDTTPLPTDHLAAGVPAVRHFAVDYSVLARSFAVRKQPDGQVHGEVEVAVFVYDAEGKLLNHSSQQQPFDMTAEGYNQMLAQHSVFFHQDIGVPAHGNVSLRIAVHDVVSDRYGIVEVPAALVRNLPAAPVQADRAASQ